MKTLILIVLALALLEHETHAYKVHRLTGATYWQVLYQ